MDKQLLMKAKTAKSPAEFLSLAKAEGVDMTEEQAAALCARLNPPPGELTDEELEAVSGGGCGGNGPQKPKPGDTIRVAIGGCFGMEGRCCTCRSTEFVIKKVQGGTCVIACRNGCAKAFSSRMAPAGEPIIEGCFAAKAEMRLSLESGKYTATHSA